MRKPLTHLFRGAPPVRSWSKHQETVKEWTLCGIQRKTPGKGHGKAPESTELASLASCPYCLELMRPSTKKQAGRG